jgi:uncharacterized protein (TIGR00251 family)
LIAVSGESTWYRYNAAARRYSLTLHVQPNARKSQVAGLHGDALRIRIAAPAVDNRANAALIEFLSRALDVPKSAIALRHGETGRRKVLDISATAGLEKRLSALA